MSKIKNRKYSLWSIVFIFAFILSIFFLFNVWNKNRIIIDAPSYYTYLPAAFIHADLRLDFIDKDPQFFRNKIWYYKIENDRKLIKHPMGISVALSPFFLAGHIASKITGAKQDGYSMPYQNAVSIGVLVYLLLGLLYLRKLLLNYFEEKIVALTIIAIVLATNLLWYSTAEGLMPHAISFSLLCICLYHFYEWLKNGMSGNLFVFAAIFGLSILIRPLAVTLIIYFFVVVLVSKGGLKNLFEYLKPRLKGIILAALLAGSIASCQMLYWKYATGKWIYDVYIDEHFVFSSPQILPFLFSFRKGIFIYTPVLVFAVIGLFRLYKTHREIFYGTIVIMPVTVFILSSWWAWSYGISWGIRPMIDYYSLLSIPLAAGFVLLFSKGRVIKFITSIIIVLFISLNLFQTWQYKNGLIHYDDMTREAYFKGFFQTKPSLEWKDMLSPYDWNRRIKGLPQLEYSREFFEKNHGLPIMIRGYNLQYLATNPKARNAVAAYAKQYSSPFCNFKTQLLEDSSVAIIANDGHYLSVNSEFDNVIIADGQSPGINARFEITFINKDDNRVAFRSKSNGKYLTVDPAFPNILFASAEVITQKEIFRLFVID
jgi:hypothetical protein